MMRTSMAVALVACCVGILVLTALGQTRAAFEPARVAAGVVRALKPAPGEIVVLRADERTQALAQATATALTRAGASVRSVPASTPLIRAGEAHRAAKVFVSLASSADLADAERIDVPGWLQAQGARYLNLDWYDGTRSIDGLPAPEFARNLFDAYSAALDEDAAAMNRRLARAESLLRSGEVRITTPHGTSLVFTTGDRPFVREDGDASAEKVANARVPAHRVVHLPAGALRIAPVETTISGRLELPEARFDTLRATDLRLFFVRGRALELQCCSGSNPPLDETAAAPLGAFASHYFQGVPLGEVTLGFNTRLSGVGGNRIVPFHGFGAGMVRLCVGDNEAIGGMVRGADSGPIRCFHLPDATIEAGGRTLVRDGTFSPDFQRAGGI